LEDKSGGSLRQDLGTWGGGGGRGKGGGGQETRTVSGMTCQERKADAGGAKKFPGKLVLKKTDASPSFVHWSVHASVWASILAYIVVMLIYHVPGVTVAAGEPEQMHIIYGAPFFFFSTAPGLFVVLACP
jgi:hypothetical protein